MNEPLIAAAMIRIILVLILGSGVFVITQRSLSSLISVYLVQSLLLAFLALVLFWQEGHINLLSISLLTLISKVIIIPLFLRSVLKSLSIKRDAEFRYVTPISSMLISIGLFFAVYQLFSKLSYELHFEPLFMLGAVIGVSLALMGMMVIFSRRKVITKTVGYLTMENGVLLFGLFVADLPFIIEVLILVDLLILLVLASLLAFGVDSSLESFHKKLRNFGSDVENKYD